MTSRKVTVRNLTGIHARPATDLVHKAKEFSSAIRLQKTAEPDSKPTNAKSLVAVLALSAGCGTELLITAEGEDEEAAAEALVSMVESGFGE